MPALESKLAQRRVDFCVGVDVGVDDVRVLVDGCSDAHFRLLKVELSNQTLMSSCDVR